MKKSTSPIVNTEEAAMAAITGTPIKNSGSSADMPHAPVSSVPLIYAKMVELMKEVGPISKDQKNVMQGFQFRGIDQFLNALHPALIKLNIFMRTRVVRREESLKDVIRSNGKHAVDKHVSLEMEYTFTAAIDGSSVSVTMPGEGIDSGDKATTKALSAALKYALIQTLAIPTADLEDADKTSPEMGRSSTSVVDKVQAAAPEVTLPPSQTMPSSPTVKSGKPASFQRKPPAPVAKQEPEASEEDLFS